jgi:hypothetical protein
MFSFPRPFVFFIFVSLDWFARFVLLRFSFGRFVIFIFGLGCFFNSTPRAPIPTPKPGGAMGNARKHSYAHAAVYSAPVPLKHKTERMYPAPVPYIYTRGVPQTKHRRQKRASRAKNDRPNILFLFPFLLRL